MTPATPSATLINLTHEVIAASVSSASSIIAVASKFVDDSHFPEGAADAQSVHFRDFPEKKADAKSLRDSLTERLADLASLTNVPNLHARIDSVQTHLGQGNSDIATDLADAVQCLSAARTACNYATQDLDDVPAMLGLQNASGKLESMMSSHMDDSGVAALESILKHIAGIGAADKFCDHEATIKARFPQHRSNIIELTAVQCVQCLFVQPDPNMCVMLELGFVNRNGKSKEKQGKAKDIALMIRSFVTELLKWTKSIDG